MVEPHRTLADVQIALLEQFFIDLQAAQGRPAQDAQYHPPDLLLFLHEGIITQEQGDCQRASFKRYWQYCHFGLYNWQLSILVILTIPIDSVTLRTVIVFLMASSCR